MTKPDPWSAVFDRFRHLAAVRGVDTVAEQIPAHRATVYRMLRNDTDRPSLAIRENITRLVETAENDSRNES